jgi:ABC-2 type transport system ATP-binding protein
MSFSGKNLLEVKHVSKQYAQHKALSNVSIAIPEQQIFGLLGPNGAGKTSLIRIINQIISLDEGSIYFQGEPLQPKHIAQIGYLPEERGLYKKMKVAEQLMYLAQLKGLPAKEAKERLKRWFQKFDIASWWDKNIEDLSKGMQQKVQFIATVLHEPKLLILDEPFSGFDPVNANLIKDEILELRQQGATIIFSTHRMESVEELCDHIALINKSQKILDGSTKAIKKQYSDHSFLVEFSGSLQALPVGFEVLQEKELEEGLRQVSVKVPEQHKPNDVLALLMPMVQIHRFQENIPSMNDIFIKVVTEKFQEPVVIA